MGLYRDRPDGEGRLCHGRPPLAPARRRNRPGWGPQWNIRSASRLPAVAGGLGFIIGDGRLKYGLEQILEMYYAWQVTKGIVVTLDFQEIVNPAYNTLMRPR